MTSMSWIVAILVFEFSLETLASWLNLQTFGSKVPTEFEEIFEPDAYARSQAYARDRSRLALIQRSVVTGATIAFVVLGGFGRIERFASSAAAHPIAQGLIFFGALGLLKSILSLPFHAFSTFGIEARYGFNRTTARLFLSDLFRGLILSVLLGGAALSGVLWFFENAGTWAWLWAWGAFSAFQLILGFLAPALILPLFNRFEPLPEGELSAAIRKYAGSLKFDLGGISYMDGSKRSTHANAFFTGFGRFRKLVLFDTLIQKHPTRELVAVLAHEVGHFKLKHIPRSMGLSLLIGFAAFYGLSWIFKTPALYEALGLQSGTAAGGLIIAAFVYTPAGRLLSILSSWISRRHEFEADAFSARTYGDPEALISALKRLSAENLSHLTPHPLKVILDYSHPPVLKRIEELRRFQQ